MMRMVMVDCESGFTVEVNGSKSVIVECACVVGEITKD